MEELNIIRNDTRCFYIKDNQVLALKLNEQNNKPGFFDIPGGKIEDNETMEQAVIREYAEETGLTITNPIYRGVINVVFPSGTFKLNTFIIDSYSGIMRTAENHVPSLFNIDEIINSDKRFACTLMLEPYFRKVLLDRTKTFELTVYTNEEEVVSKVIFEIK
jgi:8-oxo-dGTP diphosphatase